jgi:hypothetical protein
MKVDGVNLHWSIPLELQDRYSSILHIVVDSEAGMNGARHLHLLTIAAACSFALHLL